MHTLKMQEWVIERLSKTPPAESFNVLHSSVSIEGLGGGELLLKIAVGDIDEERSDLEREAESIAQETEAAARTHCEAFDGSRQRYKLTALSEDEMLGTFPFVLGAKSRSVEVGVSEAATERGLLGQLMRHNESKDRSISELVEAAMGPVLSENQALRRQRDDWESTRLQWFLQLEELMSHKHARDIELAEHQEGEDRKNRFYEAFLNKWGPEIIKRFNLKSPGKLGEKKSNGLNGTNTQAVDVSVSTYQATLRDVFKVLDRNAIYESLDDKQITNLDGLLGLDDDPKDSEAFRDLLSNVWGSLPKEIIDTIGETLMENPEKASAFLGLLGIDQEQKQ